MAFKTAAVLGGDSKSDTLTELGINEDDPGAKHLKRAINNFGTQASLHDLLSAVEEIAHANGWNIPYHLD